MGTARRSYFPGEIALAPEVREGRDEEEKKRRDAEAIVVVVGHETHPGTMWTDGSRLDSRAVGGGFCYYNGSRHQPAQQ